jgi:nitroreductase
MTVLEAVGRRRSWPKVTHDSPSHDERQKLVAAAGTVADHGALRPWRLIELRGPALERLGAALVEAAGEEGGAATRLAGQPLRAPLLIAIVAAHRPSPKVAEWEQDAAASGVAHVLSLLLAEAGWGVMWRTGRLIRSEPVRRVHELADNEQLLGWLYVGGRSDEAKGGQTARINPEDFLTAI